MAFGETYIVAIWILNKCQGVIGNLRDELEALRLGRVVDASLQDAASVPVGRDLDAVSGHCVINKLVVLGNEPVETFLNDVVAVQILD